MRKRANRGAKVKRRKKRQDRKEQQRESKKQETREQVVLWWALLRGERVASLMAERNLTSDGIRHNRCGSRGPGGGRMCPPLFVSRSFPSGKN